MFTTHTHRAGICQSCRGPNNLYQEWQYRDTAPTNAPTTIKKRSRTPSEPKMHDNDKARFVFRTACLCQNSCATNDDRQMRMQDKDTPQQKHSPSQVALMRGGRRAGYPTAGPGGSGLSLSRRTCFCCRRLWEGRKSHVRVSVHWSAPGHAVVHSMWVAWHARFPTVEPAPSSRCILREVEKVLEVRRTGSPRIRHEERSGCGRTDGTLEDTFSRSPACQIEKAFMCRFARWAEHRRGCE